MRKNYDKEGGRSMLEEVKQPLNAVLRRQAQVFRCCQSALAPRRNTENQVTEAPLGARRRQCALAQSGRSMIEMLGVLAIIGVLSVGGIAGFSKAMYRYRLNKTIEEITQIAGNVRAFFAPQKSYAGLDNNADGRNLLKKANLIPEEMWKEGTSSSMVPYYIEHPFDSGLEVYSVRKIASTACENDSLCKDQAFLIRLRDIPLEACVDLSTQDWSELNVTGIYVNNGGHAQTAKEYYLDAPVSMSDAIKVCNSDDGFTRINLNFDRDITQGDWASSIANTRAELDAM